MAEALAVTLTLGEALSPKGIRRRNGHHFLALLLSSDNICAVQGPSWRVSRKLIKDRGKEKTTMSTALKQSDENVL